MSYRIKEHDDGENFLGYVVEHKCRTWYGWTYWTHFISVAGISEQAWYYSTYEYAQDGLIFKITCDTISNTKEINYG